MIRIRLIFSVVVLLGVGAGASATDWISSPSTYTHDPATGQRVWQYKPLPRIEVPERDDFAEGGYRYDTSRVGRRGNVSYSYRVEHWGDIGYAPYWWYGMARYYGYGFRRYYGPYPYGGWGGYGGYPYGYGGYPYGRGLSSYGGPGDVPNPEPARREQPASVVICDHQGRVFLPERLEKSPSGR